MPHEPKSSRKRLGLMSRRPDRPGALERGRMRRRLRRQRQVREALLLDLGALVFELQRQGRRDPELLQAKAAELSAVDEEVRALSDTLDTQGTVLQLTAAGIAGTCSACAAIMPVDAHYCASCGASAQVALGSTAQAPSAMPRHAQPSAAPPPLAPQADEPTEIGTEERAALEAGQLESESQPEPTQLQPTDPSAMPGPADDQPTQAWAPGQAIQPGTQKPRGRARAWLQRRRGQP
ncbi:MAG: hypothetical protein M3350_08660 [Actinomycetota bacterium]|nr:hypothetical protein [Actinomycetota bacterium]